MSGQEALEDLRSKIIASMRPDQASPNPEKRPITNSDRSDEPIKRSRTGELPKGPRISDREGAANSLPVNDRAGQSRYGGTLRQGESRPPRSRFNPHERTFSRMPNASQNYQGRQPYHEYNDRSRSGVPQKRFGDSYLQDVTPIDQRRRMRPSKWDVTPKGFEKVPAERAKLSGLFPQPGQPQELDRYKLERVAMHGGTKSRRTRILFDDATSNNLTIAKMGCTLVIKHIGGTKDTSERSMEQFLKKFIAGLGNGYEMKNYSHSSDFDSVEFNSPECTTLVYASRSYINEQMSKTSLEWKRPNEYVQQLDHPDRLCGPEIIALEGLPTDHESIEKYLNENGIKFNFCTPIFDTENDVRSFTKCVLFEIAETDENELNKLKVPWFRPNYSTLTQTSSSITYQTLPAFVEDKKRSKSRVIVLLNCVDPLDLKYPPFCEEVEDNLKETLEGVETIWIKKPNVNYRLNFENIGEGIGKIYIKFKTTEASEKAMNDLPGQMFNGRAILCSYFDEEDFDLVRNH